jgi:hypothetical protein
MASEPTMRTAEAVPAAEAVPTAEAAVRTAGGVPTAETSTAGMPATTTTASAAGICGRTTDEKQRYDHCRYPN